MGKYSKFIVAVVGAIIVALNQFAGLTIGVDAQTVVNFVTPILTALGVFGLANN